MTILTLGCSNKPVEKEIYKFGCEGPSNGKKWMPCSMDKYKH
tara:strand:+ start:367 stop:492 length:126 start_codon:yes stop_codon:yes gene_type:complete